MELGRFPLNHPSSASEKLTAPRGTLFIFACHNTLLTSIYRWFNLLPNASDTDLESLANACAPATFGADNKDVMDLSYRKAGKMDLDNFMTRFDPDRLGLSEFVRGELLEGDEDSKDLRIESYKLNVYGQYIDMHSSVMSESHDLLPKGKDSFFKPHKDTPRSVDMIGSLVVIFPTPHKGGTLILRHDGQEYVFDSGLELSRVDKPSIGYVAFYSDVEHEVTVVESGYRVSLTYNLYVTKSRERARILNVSSNSDMFNELKLKQALLELLDEPTFLPEGGLIGFGLRHKYPVSKTERSLAKVLSCLKGSDAIIRRVCASVGLELKPNVIYKETYGEVLILVDKFVELDFQIDTSFQDLMCREDGGHQWISQTGFIVKSRGLEENGGGEFEYFDEDTQYRYQEVWWLTKRTELTRARTEFVVYGNESEMAHTYGDVVLIVKVGRHGNRQTDSVV